MRIGNKTKLMKSSWNLSKTLILSTLLSWSRKYFRKMSNISLSVSFSNDRQTHAKRTLLGVTVFGCSVQTNYERFTKITSSVKI